MTNLLFNHFCRCDLEKGCKHENFCLYWFTFKCVILCSVGFWYSISFDGYVCIFSWLKTLTKANVTCILQFTNLITLAGFTCSTSKSQCYLFSFNCLPIGLSYKSKWGTASTFGAMIRNTAFCFIHLFHCNLHLILPLFKIKSPYLNWSASRILEVPNYF